MAEAGRIPCCVPFCRRWRRGDPSKSTWMCWDHWKRIPLVRRKAYFRAVAERMPSWLRERGHTPRWMLPRSRRVGEMPRSIQALDRLWDRMKRDAIERAL